MVDRVDSLSSLPPPPPLSCPVMKQRTLLRHVLLGRRVVMVVASSCFLRTRDQGGLECAFSRSGFTTKNHSGMVFEYHS